MIFKDKFYIFGGILEYEFRREVGKVNIGYLKNYLNVSIFED